MASSSTPSVHNSLDIINGRWIIPKAVTDDAEFRLLWSAYEGRDSSLSAGRDKFQEQQKPRYLSQAYF
jgi:hypothetical protein